MFLLLMVLLHLLMVLLHTNKLLVFPCHETMFSDIVFMYPSQECM
jgi:hypothetical protein